MSYLSLARKYRPQNFDEIVSQEHIATTLKNAITMERVAHAYLFTGPRGVGKTSTARILAKSLNCEKGPTPAPCDKCTSCREISRGISMDVIEIDGASNRGIDEIRNLKENIKFASIHGKFRIYIIDEVHMLTQEAFNALLKTLEEPPLHVKFIFATTRPYKVLPTIISRCQRFDFRKIPALEIAKKLKDIRKKEKLDLKDDVIFLITKASDGSMRDAEVILDQLLSFAKGKVKADDLAKVLGLLEQDTLFDLADSIINNEKEKLLAVINDLINSGREPVFIASSIIDYFRNLMVAKVTKEDHTSYVTLPEDDYRKLKEQSRHFSLDEILYIIYTLSAAIELIRKTSLGRIPLEISLVKLTEKNRLISIKEIMERLSLIEKRIKKEPIEEPIEEKKPSHEVPGTEGPPEPTVIPKEEVAAEKDILLLQKIKTSWAKILNFIKGKRMSVGTFLSEGALVKIKDSVLTIGFNKNNSLHKEQLQDDVNKKFVEESIKSVIGEDVFLNIETLEGQVEGQAGVAANEEEKLEETPRESERDSSVEPIIESAIDMFKGRIVDVRKETRKEKT